MKKKAVIAICVLGVILLGVLWYFTGPGKRPLLVSRTDPPAISVDEEVHELGSVMEGTEVPYTFVVNNLGGEPLIIEDVSTSCGCTILNLKDKVIPPGKNGSLEVTMDTTMKQGYVKKAIKIYSNDPDNPMVTVFLAANVVPNPKSTPTGLKHMMSEADNDESATPKTDPHANLTPEQTAKIFTGNCATCHVNRGKDKYGKALFEADCAMCHGQNAEGLVGPALVPGNYDDPKFAAFIEETTRYGSKTHMSMPGFSNKVGGPLTDRQIKTLMSFLKEKSESMTSEPIPQSPSGGM